MTMRIVTVCSHNRTRSVMTAAMLASMLDAQVGPGVAEVSSLGFGPEGLPSIPDAVDAMRRRGLDTSSHRSCQVTAENVDVADLVLTAERDHVVKIAALSPAAFRRSMTLPEFLDRAVASDIAPGTTLRDWVTGLTAERTARAYLVDDIGEIDDPTGSAPRHFEAAVVEMEDQCRRTVAYLAQLAGSPAG